MKGNAVATLTLVEKRTASLNNTERAAIVQVCVAAHQNPEFEQLFRFHPMVCTF